MRQPAARALCLVSALPIDARNVHGVYARADMLVRSVGAVAERVDIVAFVPFGSDVREEAVCSVEARLRELWTPNIRLWMCPKLPSRSAERRRGWRFWNAYALGCFGLDWQDPYRQTRAAEHVEAIRSALASPPDLILAQTMLGLGPLLDMPTPRPPIVLDIDDIGHRVLARRLLRAPAWRGERLRLLWLPAMILGELRAARTAEMLLVCSDRDRRRLERLYRPRRVHVMPNAVPVPTIDFTQPAPPRLLFVGSFGHPPNALAAERLARRIWPSVVAAFPDAELWFAGQSPERIPSFRSPPPRTRFLGFVDDLAAVYRDTRVVACPIPYGGGTRVKIVEACAHGKAVVSNRLGAEGLAFEDGQQILIRESDGQIASACVELLRNDERALALGRSAHAMAEAHYSRGSAIQATADALRTILGTTDRQRLG